MSCSVMMTSRFMWMVAWHAQFKRLLPYSPCEKRGISSSLALSPSLSRGFYISPGVRFSRLPSKVIRIRRGSRGRRFTRRFSLYH